MKKIILSREVLLLWLPTLAFWAVLLIFKQYLHPGTLTYIFALFFLMIKIYNTYSFQKEIRSIRYLYFNENFLELSKKDASPGVNLTMYFFALGFLESLSLLNLYTEALEKNYLSAFAILIVSFVLLLYHINISSDILCKKFHNFEELSAEITKKIVVDDYPNEDAYETITYLAPANSDQRTRDRILRVIVEEMAIKWKEEVITMKKKEKEDDPMKKKKTRDFQTRKLMTP